MQRIRQTLVVLMVLAAAAVAQMARPAAAPLCLSSGTSAYRVSLGSEPADYTVRVSQTGAMPDLRLQFVDDPDAADFVLVDDVPEENACRDAAAVKTVRLADAQARETDVRADVTVSLDERRTPDHRIYVRSAHYSRADAAALAAVMWKDAARRHLAVRE